MSLVPEMFVWFFVLFFPPYFCQLGVCGYQGSSVNIIHVTIIMENELVFTIKNSGMIVI